MFFITLTSNQANVKHVISLSSNLKVRTSVFSHHYVYILVVIHQFNTNDCAISSNILNIILCTFVGRLFNLSCNKTHLMSRRLLLVPKQLRMKFKANEVEL